ncbi:hypothetical protein [Parapedobacter tibetensis]|uniref:hypothetical protein n=1 Tax=Parapedobacter tibetensis TaxID=2972951 RepID=UPI00214D7EEB|nr:hypothetical protein [Parapedobacter tibetensis]
MKEQEIQEMQVMLKDQQDVSVQMNERLHRLEAQKPETKDYSAELAHISGQLERLLTDDTLIGLKDSIRKQATASSNLVTAIGQQQAMQETMIREMPQRIKFDVEHRLISSQRPYIITGVVLVLIAVFSLFACIQLWRANVALRDSDVKIRMVRLLYPQMSLDIDSIYNNSPKELKIWVKQEEERLLAIRKAEENAKQSTEQAERATEELKRLKQQDK